MGKIAFVFSGQGAQKTGMGKSLYENIKSVKDLFDCADSIRNGTVNQMFEGSEEELRLTLNTQPCLYLADLGAALALKECGITPDCVAGFSLGEIPALAFAGAYSHDDGFRIVCARAKFMHEACEGHDPVMFAVMKLSAEKVSEICKDFDNLYPVNFNSPVQTVVSGLKSEGEAFMNAVRENGGRCLELSVSGAFHSPFMNEASKKFADFLNDFDMKKPQTDVYANISAQPYGENIAENLAAQINSPVLWQKTVENMIEAGVTDFIEVGCGKTLMNLIGKISKDVRVYSVEDYESLIKTAEELKNNA